MSLRHAILGILDFCPMHGYQLKRVLELGISHFWPVNLGAIYPSLRALESEGLVAHHTEPTAEGRPDRKVYTITETGREELARWLELPPEGPTVVRVPLYLKLLFAQRENIGDTLQWVEAERERCLRGATFLEAQLANPQAFSTFFVKFMRQSGAAHLRLEAELLGRLGGRIRRGLAKRRSPREREARRARSSGVASGATPPAP